MTRKPFYPNLRRSILEHCITQGEFAKSLNIVPATVSNVINGRWQLKDCEKQQWADMLDETVDYLFEARHDEVVK